METSAIRLQLKLAFEFTKKKSSANVNRSPNNNRIPRHGKVGIKYLPSLSSGKNCFARKSVTFCSFVTGFILCFQFDLIFMYHERPCGLLVNELDSVSRGLDSSLGLSHCIDGQETLILQCASPRYVKLGNSEQ